MVSDEEAVRIVQGREREKGERKRGGDERVGEEGDREGVGRDMGKAAVLLRDYAYLRGSTDDISVVCVCLDEK